MTPQMENSQPFLLAVARRTRPALSLSDDAGAVISKEGDMGFCGLNHWVDSDMAAGTFDVLMRKILKDLHKEVKTKDNEFNTSGPENVLLIMNSLFRDPEIVDSYQDELAQLFQRCTRILEKDLARLKNSPDHPDPDYLCDLRNLLKKSRRRFYRG